MLTRALSNGKALLSPSFPLTHPVICSFFSDSARRGRSFSALKTPAFGSLTYGPAICWTHMYRHKGRCLEAPKHCPHLLHSLTGSSHRLLRCGAYIGVVCPLPSPFHHFLKWSLPSSQAFWSKLEGPAGEIFLMLSVSAILHSNRRIKNVLLAPWILPWNHSQLSQELTRS